MSYSSPDEFSGKPAGRATLQDKIYIGFVKNADDVLRMGRLAIWIPELSGDPNDESTWFIVSYCAPFAGATNVYKNTNERTYTATQKSYGMWFVPPDINNEVVCAFINGDPGRGIWLGCLYQQNMNHMVPGIPGEDTSATLPAAEYNKKLPDSNLNSPTRPLYEPLSDALITQGLDQDTVRGVTDSGARRDAPYNTVYGILTPGGSQLVFDDSPDNSLIRLRTQHGAQIMINDTVGCIYLNSVDGKNWISMDANGKIDIYAQDDISLRTQGSLNLRGDLDVNIEAGRDVNIRARGRQTGAAVTPNPLSNPPTPSESPGPIVVIGDSIAVGIGSKITSARTMATVGDNSTTILNKLKSDPSLKNATNAIISAGSNDITPQGGNPNTLRANLEQIRSFLQASNYVWILPYYDAAKQVVADFANGKNDRVIDLANYPTADNLHPRSYDMVATAAQAQCIPSTTGATGPTGPTTTGGSTGATGATGTGQPTAVTQDAASANAAQTTDITWQSIAIPFVKREESGRRGPSLTAFPDPPNRTDQFSIGHGHLIKNNLARGESSINCGSAGRVPIRGQFGKDTTCTAEQAEGMFAVDIEALGAAVVRRAIRGAWDLLGPYQRAALVSYAYNVGNLGQPVSKGLTNYINSRDIESAAKTIETSALGWSGNPTGLTARRLREANLYREKPDLAGTGSPANQVDGYPTTPSDTGANGQGAPISTSDSNLEGGFIKIQSQNSMHLLSAQHMFLTSQQDMHRLVGQNLFDSAIGNVNRIAGGYSHESVRADWTVGASGFIQMDSPKIDMNGPAPPAAVAAAAAIGKEGQKQTDAVVNSFGNVTAILTDTIMPHLPYHEPYANHGGRNFENIRDATSVNTNTGLRDGEIIARSDRPLDVYGTPRSDMPPAVYRGDSYNSQGQPIYRYESPIGNTTILSAGSLNVSDSGKQFITSRENGSYRPITVGNPPKSEIGYGHGISAEEISKNSVIINGLEVSLSAPFSQQQINDLFTQDLQKVQDWVKPEIKVGLSQTQYDMFCSLAFNIGEGNFKSSTALKAFNEGNLQSVPNLWMQHTKNAAGQIVNGLVIRRRAEVVNFMGGPQIDNTGGSSNAMVDATQF
jgi:hypothetical protein